MVGDKGFMLKIMEVFLDIPWTCCLCGVASQSCYKLSLHNKHNVIVNDDMDNRQWIRCFKCFKSFNLSCLSKDDGQFFDDYVIFRWFKFTLKLPYRITHDKLRLAIWDTSFWTFWLKFGHKTP